MIDSYRLALGDFEVAENFGEDKNFIFWTVFFIGTLISLLIILNMVIAVMGAAFTKIEENQQSYIYRSKIKLIIENHHRLNDSIKDQLKEYKYLLAVDVDPEVDPIEKESVETRLSS